MNNSFYTTGKIDRMRSIRLYVATGLAWAIARLIPEGWHIMIEPSNSCSSQGEAASAARASDEEIARAIINLAASGTWRILELGGDCDSAERTYEPILRRLGLPNIAESEPLAEAKP